MMLNKFLIRFQLDQVATWAHLESNEIPAEHLAFRKTLILVGKFLVWAPELSHYREVGRWETSID